MDLRPIHSPPERQLPMRTGVIQLKEQLKSDSSGDPSLFQCDQLFALECTFRLAAWSTDCLLITIRGS